MPPVVDVDRMYQEAAALKKEVAEQTRLVREAERAADEEEARERAAGEKVRHARSRPVARVAPCSRVHDRLQRRAVASELTLLKATLATSGRPKRRPGARQFAWARCWDQVVLRDRIVDLEAEGAMLRAEGPAMADQLKQARAAAEEAGACA